MSAAFDPYYTWLAIPPEEQPPNNYRLLGLRPFEDNLEVIENAANQRMAYLRSFQTGKNSAASQKLLNEIAQARVSLLNPDKKVQYDAWLHQQREAAGLGQQETESPPLSAAMQGFVQSLRTAQADHPEGIPLPPAAAPRLESWRRSRSKKPALVYAAVAAVVLLAGVGLWLSSSGELPPSNIPLNTQQAVSPPPPQEKPTDAVEPAPKEIPGSRPETTESEPSPGTTSEEAPMPGDVRPLVGEPRLHMPSVLGPKVPLDDQPKPAATSGDDQSPMAMSPTTPAEPPPAESPLRNLAELLSDDVTAKGPSRLRLPVPDAAVQDSARKLLDETYGEEKAGADSAVKQLVLVQKLMDDVARSEENAARRFVALSMARDLAVEAASPYRAMEIAEELAGGYEVDRLEMMAECLEASQRAAKKSSEYETVAKAALPLIDDAVAADRYDLAKQIGELTASTARRAREYSIAREAVERMHAAEEEEKQFAAVKSSFDALEANPNDAAANLAAGRHYVRKGNWDKALPHLAAGDDMQLKQAAEKELAGAASPEEQAALGDVWWDLAEKRPGTERNALMKHAGTWYSRAQVLLPAGVTQRKVENRLKELAETTEKAGSEPPSRPAAGLPVKARRLPHNRWAPLFTSPKELAGWETGKADFTYANGILDLRDSSIHYPAEAADMAIQAKVKKVSGQNLSLQLRNGPDGSYSAWYNGGTAFGIGRSADGEYQDLKTGGPPNPPGDGFLLTFSAEGPTLKVFVNGQQILEAEDPTLTKGRPGLSTVDGSSLFAEVQVRLLDKP